MFNKFSKIIALHCEKYYTVLTDDVYNVYNKMRKCACYTITRKRAEFLITSGDDLN